MIDYILKKLYFIPKFVKSDFSVEKVDEKMRIINKFFITFFNELYIYEDEIRKLTIKEICSVFFASELIIKDLGSYFKYLEYIENKQQERMLKIQQVDLLMIRYIKDLNETFVDEIIYRVDNEIGKNINDLYKDKQLEIMFAMFIFFQNEMNCISYDFDPNFFIKRKDFFNAIKRWSKYFHLKRLNYLYEINNSTNILIKNRLLEYLSNVFAKIANEEEYDSIFNFLEEANLSVLDPRMRRGLNLNNIPSFINNFSPKINCICNNVDLNKQIDPITLFVFQRQYIFFIEFSHFENSLFRKKGNVGQPKERTLDFKETLYYQSFLVLENYKDRIYHKKKNIFSFLNENKDVTIKLSKIIKSIIIFKINRSAESALNIASNVFALFAKEHKVSIEDLESIITRSSEEIKRIIENNNDKLGSIERQIKLLVESEKNLLS